jgi:hypothetical protein
VIIARLFTTTGEALGEWDFATLPRIGETVVVRDIDNQPYRVTAVEHYPVPTGYQPGNDVIPYDQRVVVKLQISGLPQ